MNWEVALKDYLHYLKLERGLSDNTLQNYRRDVVKLIRYLKDIKDVSSPVGISHEIMSQFVYDLGKSVSPRSQARIISGLNK